MSSRQHFCLFGVGSFKSWPSDPLSRDFKWVSSVPPEKRLGNISYWDAKASSHIVDPVIRQHTVRLSDIPVNPATKKNRKTQNVSRPTCTCKNLNFCTARFLPFPLIRCPESLSGPPINSHSRCNTDVQRLAVWIPYRQISHDVTLCFVCYIFLSCDRNKFLSL